MEDAQDDRPKVSGEGDACKVKGSDLACSPGSH